MKLFIVRHGETEYNLDRRMQGHLDIPLNEAGEQQAKTLSSVLAKAGVKFDQVYSSDLKRASQTAELITGNKQPIKRIEDLRERNLGELQGLLYSEALDKMKKEGKKSFIEYGEQPDAHIARVGRAWDFINNNIALDDQNVLIVSHGGTLRALYKWLITSGRVTMEDQLDRMNDRLGNCCVTIVEDGKFKIFAKQFTDTIDAANDLL